MAHGVLNLVYDHQSGPRGDDKVFAPGMLMGMARRPLGDGTLQFRAMLSPDPLMGKSGYPLLLASGETANGVDHLIDRQHPHDFFMELSGSVSQNIGAEEQRLPLRRAARRAGVRPARLHAPRGDHGFAGGADQPPLARFDAHQLRRPDRRDRARPREARGQPLQRPRARPASLEHRDRTAGFDRRPRLVEPDRTLSLQGSWGHFEEPEQLEPGVDQRRWSASALYAREIAPGWKLAGTLAWGRKSIKDHHGEWLKDDAYVAEASLKHGGWTVFGRGEITENRELLD